MLDFAVSFITKYGIVVVFISGVIGFGLAATGAASFIGKTPLIPTPSNYESYFSKYFELAFSKKFKKERWMIVGGILLDVAAMSILWHVLPPGHK